MRTQKIIMKKDPHNLSLLTRALEKCVGTLSDNVGLMMRMSIIGIQGRMKIVEEDRIGIEVQLKEVDVGNGHQTEKHGIQKDKHPRTQDRNTFNF